MPKEKWNVWIIDEMHEGILQAFSEHDLRYEPNVQSDNFFNSGNLDQVEVLLVRSKVYVSKAHMDAMPNLKIIGRSGSGMDNIDLQAAEERGIVCVNAAEGNRNAVGEHALGMLLNLSNRISKGYDEVRQGIWDREGNRGFELEGKTIGIYGYGNTGSRLGELLAPFHVRVLAYDKYKTGIGSGHVEQVSERHLMQESDVISFHIPLTKETKGIICKEFVNRVRKPFVLLNTSRGKIMQTAAVLEGLDSGKIIGFATDVLENEKLPSYSEAEKQELSRLTSHSNVLISPHVAGWTVESYKKLSSVLAEKVKQYMRSHEETISSDKHKIL